MNRRLPEIVAFGLLLLGFLPGCKSFDDAIKPVIDNTPDSDSAQLYVTGTKPYSASDAGNMQLNVWRVDADRFPDSVLVYARVMDKDGNFISNLAPPYYEGAEDYKEIWSGITEQIGTDETVHEIAEFDVREFSDKDGIPFELALALDYSGSMGSNIKFLEDAATTFINLKLPQDRIAIVKFDDTPKLVVPPTQSKADLITQYGKTGLEGFGGYTALYAAGRLGGEQVMKAAPGNPRALILFTDGEDNSSKVTATQLYDFCRTNSIPVFAVAFGAVNGDVLGALASGTGGRFYQTNDPKELEAIFKDIYLSLRNYYLIRYRPPRVDGKHFVSIALNPPNSSKQIAAKAVYETYGNIFDKEEPIKTTFFNDVFFDYNSAELRPEALKEIKVYVASMKESKTMLLEVRGHTDSIGGDGYNDSLSVKRANAVKQAFVEMGIEPERVRARGFGRNLPVSPNDTEEGRRRNRRTEFLILRK